jgi:transposase
MLTDTLGLLLAVTVQLASAQDRDGAEALLREARRTFPFIERAIGDAGCQGRRMEAVMARTGTWTLQSEAHERSRLAGVSGAHAV